MNEECDYSDISDLNVKEFLIKEEEERFKNKKIVAL